MCCRVESLF